MSVSHHHAHKLTSTELDDLLDEALANPKVKARLARPFKLVTDKDIALLGSSSIGGKNVYLDRHFRYRNWPYGIIPVGGDRFDAKPGLIRHERLEQIVEDVCGWPYMPIAHPVATQYEHRLYRERDYDPAMVEKAYAPYIRTEEREPLSMVPVDLDLRPMAHDQKLLERTKAAQDKQKVTQESVAYVGRSAKPNQSCAGCVMFVDGRYGGPGCTLVKSPIAPDGWCKRFYKGVLGA
jgi:hypothetical protein